MVVHSKEIQPGIFCGNTIISPNNPCIKYINTTDKHVHIANFTPDMELLRTYHILNTHINKHNDKNKLNEIIKQIDVSNVPPYTKNDFYN